MSNGVKYEFPTPDKKDWWETEVRNAITKRTLDWTHQIDQQWLLSGRCPRCNDEMSNYVDLEVPVAGTLQESSFGSESAPTFRTEIVCNCDEHGEKKKGCGYGRSLEIELDTPNEGR